MFIARGSPNPIVSLAGTPRCVQTRTAPVRPRPRRWALNRARQHPKEPHLLPLPAQHLVLLVVGARWRTFSHLRALALNSTRGAAPTLAVRVRIMKRSPRLHPIQRDTQRIQWRALLHHQAVLVGGAQATSLTPPLPRTLALHGTTQGGPTRAPLPVMHIP